MLALAILVAGVFYLDQYRAGLIDAKIDSLETTAEIMAGAVGESALTGPPEALRIDPTLAARIISRLAESSQARVRLFDASGVLIADSRSLIAAGREVQLDYLPPPDSGNFFSRFILKAYDWIMPRLPRQGHYPPYRERAEQRASDYAETRKALVGESASAVRQNEDAELVLSAAVPLRQLHQVLGALMLSADGREIEESIRLVRVGIIEVFAVTAGITVLLSMFLAGTIARPVRRLARAADRVRRWRGQRVEIPDLSNRRDEIGDLSAALREMTTALYGRLDAIEAFAADVSHELKNPLSSLGSAVETLERTNDPSQQHRLLQVIGEDVRRLDRLITDISNASRVDAEMLRAEAESVDLAQLLETVVEVYRGRVLDGAPRFELAIEADAPLIVDGVAGRLGQVIDNLVSNAVSFSPPGGTIRLRLARVDQQAEIAVEDEGAGLQEDQIERLFQRFYSKRPPEEDFGRHSGLGLSIARQIVEAHGGSVVAENRRDAAGRVLGARFVVRLPL